VIGVNCQTCSDIVGNILTDVSPDPTDREDVLYAELAQGRISKALAVAHEIDVWLVAHMADMMAPLGLIDLDVDDE
jgi:nuclear pore complex protein Nup85